MAAIPSLTTMAYPLYGHPPNQAENTPSTLPWWAFVVGALVILLVFLTCIAIGAGICMWNNERRITQEVQLVAEARAAKRGQAGIGSGAPNYGAADHALQILRREPSALTVIIAQPYAAPVVEVWDVDDELYESGSSWSIDTIKAWVNDIPDGVGPDMADLETQLFWARLYEELWMGRTRRLDTPKVTFANNLARREHVSGYADES